MATQDYLIAIALIEQNQVRAMPLGGKEIKKDWKDGDTTQFLKYLGNLSKEIWTASFIKYKGIEFTSISKNDEI